MPKARMIIIKLQRLLCNLSTCVLFSILCTVGSVQGKESNEVIANPSVGEQTLSKNALRGIFGMRLQIWPDGSSVKVFVLPDEHPVHVGFSKEVVNVFPYQLRAAWDRLTFSGTGQSPIEVRSEEDMRTKIATTPGAIGYLRGAMVNDQIYVLQIK